MKLIEQHKAGIITFLISGIVLFLLFSVHISKQPELIAESYFDLTPEPEKKEDVLAENLQEKLAATNKAFNEDKEFKEIMKNFKTVSTNDLERTLDSKTEAKEDLSDDSYELASAANSRSYALNKQELESFKKLNETLKKQTDKEQADEHAAYRSTLTYSLVGRTLLNYKTPRYLCEDSGKIVVTIAVNDKGYVKEAFINGASTSENQCLREHAVEYAKAVLFNSSDKGEQLGTITFFFKGKN